MRKQRVENRAKLLLAHTPANLLPLYKSIVKAGLQLAEEIHLQCPKGERKASAYAYLLASLNCAHESVISIEQEKKSEEKTPIKRA